ncbi:hydroxyethylthiazole kinase [Desulfohalovibrio reitneri]|uniref:hydroxyethylthiazole kinase n=1 Tax=Desulfohalovibrio reitneri TaxID=1307759 RepID=UPI0004A77FD6|nr:hydroxyethylthiazole kinase [Desulfohalovibrio reitneri]
MHDSRAVQQSLAAIRGKGPLVHNITNFVVMNSTANALLSLGASPIMAHAVEEVEELAAISQALVINIGTLSPRWVESMRRAGYAARERGVPIVLDPVGAGASVLRTESCLALLREVGPGIVRGNGAEIAALASEAVGFTGEAQGRGVDSLSGPEAAVEAATALAEHFACVVVVSGAFDLITDGTRQIRVLNGDPLMPRVTGMGCSATAVIGAFAAVGSSNLEAAANGMAVMGVAGEMAAQSARGPGTFQAAFLDALYLMTPEELDSRLRLEEG